MEIVHQLVNKMTLVLFILNVLRLLCQKIHLRNGFCFWIWMKHYCMLQLWMIYIVRKLMDHRPNLISSQVFKIDTRWLISEYSWDLIFMNCFRKLLHTSPLRSIQPVNRSTQMLFWTRSILLVSCSRHESIEITAWMSISKKIATRQHTLRTWAASLIILLKKSYSLTILWWALLCKLITVFQFLHISGIHKTKNYYVWQIFYLRTSSVRMLPMWDKSTFKSLNSKELLTCPCKPRFSRKRRKTKINNIATLTNLQLNNLIANIMKNKKIHRANVIVIRVHMINILIAWN